MDTLKIKTIISPILGIISIGLFFVPSGLGFDFLIYHSVALFCAILGLIWGIKGFKSGIAKKSLAILGIILCSIGLLGVIYMFFVWIIMGGPTEINQLWKRYWFNTRKQWRNTTEWVLITKQLLQ